MTDKSDKGGNEPSLELPSLSLPGLRRRKKKDEPAPAAPEPEAAPRESTPAPPPATRPEPVPMPPAAAPSPAPTSTVPAPSPSAPAPRTGPADDDGWSFLPRLPGRIAAAVTGLVVGLFGTAATYLSLRGCEALQGTESCGRPGFFVLLAILALMVVLGSLLLTGWRLTEPGSTSFLAVGIITVVAMVLLLDAIFSPWMFLVVPLLGAGAYALSHAVTDRFSDERPAD